ncbi:MAG TPA: hypothetical protein VFY40_06805 [Blastocatellia bacterium]|nr:hypothetical protein [Blastocatellia bacterium]
MSDGRIEVAESCPGHLCWSSDDCPFDDGDRSRWQWPACPIFAAVGAGAEAKQLEIEQMTPHTCELSNPRLKINTSGEYVYFAMRMTALL